MNPLFRILILIGKKCAARKDNKTKTKICENKRAQNNKNKGK